MNRAQRIFATLVAAGLLSSTSALAEILIATGAPLTGQSASLGEQMKEGAQMAVADINAAGGVLGQRLRLTIADDGCDAEQAVAVANKFTDEGVVFVAGHFCSGASIPASKVYEEAGIVQISPGSTNPKLTDEGGPNVFRVCGRDDQQGTVAGDFLAETYAGKNVAILHDASAYGKGLADETKKQFNKRGMREAMYEAYDEGEKNLAALV